MYEALVKIPIEDFHLDGILFVPVRALSLVIFAHGSGNNRFSPRNKMIARELHNAGYGTLLFDFMGEHEAEDYEKRFEIDTLSRRLVHVTGWLHSHEAYHTYDLSYFGAGLGGAMALNAAAELPHTIKAVACRGAQTANVTEENIAKIKSPVLLIAGEHDSSTIRKNRALTGKLTCPAKVVTIPQAGYLMEKPAMMRQIAQVTIAWFDQFLRKGKMDPAVEYDTPDTEY